MEEARKPSRWFYLLAILLFFGGPAAGIGTVLKSAKGDYELPTQILVPGEQKLELDSEGTYTIFHEYETVYNNQVFSEVDTADISGLEIKLRSEKTGEEIELSPSVTAHYKYGSHSARAILKFNIDSPGRYILSGEHLENDRPKAVLTVRHGFISKFFGTVFSAFTLMSVGPLLGIVLAVFTFLKRR